MENLRKLQLAELHILKDIDAVCKKYNLRYYLIGGTLLGAVRHGGFIPWDDDLDITMYRKDLNALLKIIKREYSDKYFVQTFETDQHYTRYIPKIRLNGTRQVEKIYEGDDANKGIYVDIFPLDHTTKSDGISLKVRGKILRFLFAYKTAKHTNSWIATPVKTKIIKIVKPLTKLIPDSLINKLFDYCCTATDIPGAKFTTSFASHYKWKKQMFTNDVYGEGIKYKFEDAEFVVPSKYEIYLKQIFGKNYMELPPLEKRNSGHILTEIDLGKYETIINE